MGRLNDKIAIITGGARGLGKACAELFVREGARVYITDVRTEEGEQAAREIGGGCRFIQHDVTSEEDWARVITAVEDEAGHPNILVNNAGIAILASFEETTLEQWRRTQAVNAESVFLGCKAIIAPMRAAGGGSIVNISSIAALVGESFAAAYAGSKGSVRSFTKAVAVHCAQQGYAIRCNSVHPAGIDTPMASEMRALWAADGSERVAAAAEDNVSCKPMDIAYGVLYLASDESRFVSGSELVLDGTITATAGTVPSRSA